MSYYFSTYIFGRKLFYMGENLQLNADRFVGFADVYDHGRPKCPENVKKIILKYLGYNPSLVVDMGCGTGLSTIIWSNVSDKVIGIDPSIDMIEEAKKKASALDNLIFISSFSDDTGLKDHCADVITCSQSFHWMNPETTLNEVYRILKMRGIFAVYDYDWSPVCNWEAEIEYQKLFKKVREMESTHGDIKDSFVRWDKNNHLSNIEKLGRFRYTREIVFSNCESCNAQRFIEMALSHGGLQASIRADRDEIIPYLTAFKKKIMDIYGDNEFEICFCYRMHIGIK
jgi:ubiquinone/menaquinone biosynthesis C-methylase UbiE